MFTAYTKLIGITKLHMSEFTSKTGTTGNHLAIHNDRHTQSPSQVNNQGIGCIPGPTQDLFGIAPNMGVVVNKDIPMKSL